MTRSAGLFPAGALALWLAACGFDEVDKPRAPDTEAERALLEQPDGVFEDSDDAEAVFRALEEASQNVRALCGYAPIAQPGCLLDADCRRCGILVRLADAVGKVLASLEESDEGDMPDAGGNSIPGLSGVLEVDVTCKGFEGADEPNPADGAAHFTLGFTGRGIDSTVWGTLDDCAEIIAGEAVRLTGEFVIDYDAEAVRLRDFESVPALLVFHGSVLDVERGVERDSRVLVYQRLDGTGPVAIGLDTHSRGTFVMRADDDRAQLESAGGTFTCNSEEATCSLDD